MLENSPNILTHKCNEEIWRDDIPSICRRSNDVALQNIPMHTVQVTCAMTDARDKIINLNLKSDQYKEIVTPVVDFLALLEVVTAEINQFWREKMKDRLPAKHQPLTKTLLQIPNSCFPTASANSHI